MISDTAGAVITGDKKRPYQQSVLMETRNRLPHRNGRIDALTNFVCSTVWPGDNEIEIDQSRARIQKSQGLAGRVAMSAGEPKRERPMEPGVCPRVRGLPPFDGACDLISAPNQFTDAQAPTGLLVAFPRIQHHHIHDSLQNPALAAGDRLEADAKLVIG
ncbi:uncharacterized protein GLRG_11747 [Colletotrichum graminicola M1.001]|uniref:Uncharacterized protein n=1 Tax=Colletotrichum graminicola (strain M1.001 / M2 / FGSC 10212) TaxID=645133 RepID=E3R0G4_COLGM|nr:uncharacterized protein GLRG_11747 [Colletotrichum graminicola M1.001]EFQ36602.1 hypothetical protein GLRG_11747 [Colletotrichum graminicola M1.001]